MRCLSPAAVILTFLLGVQVAWAQTTLPDRTADDVAQSYRLLETTAYRVVDAQTLLDAARAALIEYARKHGATITVAALHDEGSDDQTLADLDAAITQAAAAAHGDPTDYAYAAIDGMANAFGDRYTTFMTPDEYRQFTDALDPQRVSGIGIFIEPDPSGYVRLSYVVPDTPADRAGLREGDLVLSVDGTTTKGLSIDGASKLLHGKAGTTVNLEIAEAATGPSHTLSITRTEVQPPTVFFKMLPGDIGYIYVQVFGKATPDEFDVALQRLHDEGARALVLDLRNDTGGFVDSAVDISAHFVGGRQAILTEEERGNQDTTICAASLPCSDSNNQGQVGLPMMVLVNGYTASASEIAAGALQDDGAAVLLGTKTFGKGVMQTLTPLPDGAAIKITTAHYLTPRKRDINLRGIDPDFVIDENRDARFGELDNDAQLRAAVTYLQKKIARAPGGP